MRMERTKTLPKTPITLRYCRSNSWTVALRCPCMPLRYLWTSCTIPWVVIKKTSLSCRRFRVAENEKSRSNDQLLSSQFRETSPTGLFFIKAVTTHLIRTTVAPRNTGRQGTNKLHLLLADFCYCQYRKLKEISWRDQGLAFVIGGFPLLLRPVLRGLTVSEWFLGEF